MMRFGLTGIGLIVAWLISAVVAVVLIALAVLAIIALVKHIKNGNGHTAAPAQAQEKSPLDLLDERYAKGEIDDEDYARRKERLKGNHHE